MRAHDAFESLAGALALGEATERERAAFAAHAATCALCREAGRESSAALAAIAAARDAERWRPSLEDAVLRRIGEANARRQRFTVAALGWALACSIVLEAAFTSGFAGRLATAFRDAGTPRAVAFSGAPRRLTPIRAADLPGRAGRFAPDARARARSPRRTR